MTAGRFIVLTIIAVTAVFAGVMWYAQTRAYYDVVGGVDLAVTTPLGDLLALPHSGLTGVDAETSPLRFRACFTLDEGGLAALAEAAAHPDPVPLVAPGWFECFDARALAQALETGAAQAVMSVHEIARGVDRVIAAYPDGRAFAWHQLNGTLEQ